jgi:hypothetical protein
VVICDQGALDRCAGHPVVPDADVECEQPLNDAGSKPGGVPGAMAFEAELVLQRPDDGLNALPQPVREGPGSLLLLAGGAERTRSRPGW